MQKGKTELGEFLVTYKETFFSLNLGWEPEDAHELFPKDVFL